MASTLKHLRSSTANKRPTASGIADGQIAINTASGTPALFFKDNADNIVKVGPVHVGATAPNTSPAGSAGNSTGELWVDNSLATQGLKYYSGSEFINLTPSGTASAAGLVELATSAETQTGSDAVRAVTPAGLQSKVSDSTSTTSSTTIASATAVKSAYDLANAALPKSGGTVTGEIIISPSGSLAFEGSTDDSFETRIVVTDPTADRTITLPNTTGTVITTGDSGTVTSTMIANGTIVDADINASAAIAPSKLGSGALPNGVTVSSTNIVNGTIVDADVNASAAIAGTKISPDFGGQNVVTTGSVTGASLIPSSATVPTNGLYLPAANSVALSTNGTGRLFVDATGQIGIGTTSPSTLLHLSQSSSGIAQQILSVVNPNSAATGTAARIWLSGADASTRGAHIDAVVTSAGNSHDLTFSTSASASAPQERLRITSAGLVGIGTSAPAGNLNVSTSTAAGPSLTYDTNNIANFDYGTVQLALGINPSAPFGAYLQGRDNTNSSRVISLNPEGGNVGLGTANPLSLLHVQQGSDGEVARFQRSGGTNIPILRLNLTESTKTAEFEYTGTDASGNIAFKSGSTERARIDSSGRLLVGTSSNSGGALLQVNGNRIRVATAKTPASASDTGTAGEICWDASYVYVCTATNTWKRAALSTW